ncbi:hypothetical protein HDU79_010903 [Rhizoclosmatium sp. JEL0117]|nr:hypothetical protein HDU79_010903 [Rhizoclosmatium sp. JEL0117]
MKEKIPPFPGEEVRSLEAVVMPAGIHFLANKKLQPVATYILTSSTTQAKSIDNHPVFKGAVEAGIPVVTRAFLEDRLRLGQTASRQCVAEICVAVRWVFSSGDYLDIGMSKLNSIHNYTVITGYRPPSVTAFSLLDLVMQMYAVFKKLSNLLEMTRESFNKTPPTFLCQLTSKWQS